MPDSELRERLAAIGERRKEAREVTAELAADTRAIVAEARGVIPMNEVARLVGVDRATLYQTYLGSPVAQA